MKPVMQTKRGGPDVPPEQRGDCWAACLASVLEVPLNAVTIPHRDDPEWHWWDATQEALADHGYYAVVADSRIYPDDYWFAGLPSKNLGANPDGSRVKHIIVMRGGLVAHDPCLGERYEPGTPIDQLDVIDAYVLVPREISSLAALFCPTHRDLCMVTMRPLAANDQPSEFAAALTEFHGHPNSILDDKTNGIPLRRVLLHEEFAELIEAIDEGDMAHIAREMADVLYIVFGTALVYRIDLDAAFREVHRAAMDKMEAGLRREDGKILKPPGFVPPDMTEAVRNAV